jgi:hypothetical protein
MGGWRPAIASVRALSFLWSVTAFVFVASGFPLSGVRL